MEVSGVQFEYNDATKTLTLKEDGREQTESGRAATLADYHWYSFTARIYQVNYVVAEEGVQYILPDAFADYDYLKKITLPSTLKSVGERAFHRCPNLDTIQMNKWDMPTELKPNVFDFADDNLWGTYAYPSEGQYTGRKIHISTYFIPLYQETYGTRHAVNIVSRPWALVANIDNAAKAAKYQEAIDKIDVATRIFNRLEEVLNKYVANNKGSSAQELKTYAIEVAQLFASQHSVYPGIAVEEEIFHAISSCSANAQFLVNVYYSISNIIKTYTDIADAINLTDAPYFFSLVYLGATSNETHLAYPVDQFVDKLTTIYYGKDATTVNWNTFPWKYYRKNLDVYVYDGATISGNLPDGVRLFLYNDHPTPPAEWEVIASYESDNIKQTLYDGNHLEIAVDDKLGRSANLPMADGKYGLLSQFQDVVQTVEISNINKIGADNFSGMRNLYHVNTSKSNPWLREIGASAFKDCAIENLEFYALKKIHLKAFYGMANTLKNFTIQMPDTCYVTDGSSYAYGPELVDNHLVVGNTDQDRINWVFPPTDEYFPDPSDPASTRGNYYTHFSQEIGVDNIFDKLNNKTPKPLRFYLGKSFYEYYNQVLHEEASKKIIPPTDDENTLAFWLEFVDYGRYVANLTDWLKQATFDFDFKDKHTYLSVGFGETHQIKLINTDANRSKKVDFFDWFDGRQSDEPTRVKAHDDDSLRGYYGIGDLIPLGEHEYRFSSSNPEVATVDNTGLVKTGNVRGTTTIKVEHENLTRIGFIHTYDAPGTDRHYKQAPYTNNGKLTIYGTAIESFVDGMKTPWHHLRDNIEYLNLPDIEVIGAGAFQGFKNLKGIYAPNLKKIGAGAFMQCTGLETLEIPDGLTEIGDAAFGYCTAIRYIKKDGETGISFSKRLDPFYALDKDKIVIFGRGTDDWALNNSLNNDWWDSFSWKGEETKIVTFEEKTMVADVGGDTVRVTVKYEPRNAAHLRLEIKNLNPNIARIVATDEHEYIDMIVLDSGTCEITIAPKYWLKYPTEKMRLTTQKSAIHHLDDLSVDKGTLVPSFNKDITNYVLKLDNPSETDIEIKATAAHPKSSVSGDVGKKHLVPGEISVFVVNVKAQNLTDVKTYRISVLNQEAHNKYLGYLSIPGVKLEPEFSYNVMEYQAVAPYAMDHISIHAETLYPKSTISGISDNIPLNFGMNTHSVHVTAKDGSVNTYVVHINRERSAKPGNIRVTDYYLYPAYQPNIYEYTLPVSTSEEEIFIEAVKNDPNDPPATGDLGSQALRAEENVFRIFPADKTADANEYAITVIRSEAELSAIRISGKAIRNFDPKRTNYVVNVLDTVESINIEADAKENGVRVSGDLGEKEVSQGEENLFEIKTELGNKKAEKTYRITVRAGNFPSLQSLVVGGASIYPAFSPEVTNYKLFVPEEKTHVNISAVAEEKYDVSGDVGYLAADEDTTFNIKVKSPETDLETDYELSVFRSSVGLKYLTVSKGVLIPEFSPDVTQYKLLISRSATNVEIDAECVDPSGTVLGDKGLKIINAKTNELKLTAYTQTGKSTDYTISIERHDDANFTTDLIAPAESYIRWSGGTLYIHSPEAERIAIYSVDGLLLHEFYKPAGEQEFYVGSGNGILIIKGSSGWVKKALRKP
jgi:hypothetical protein